MSETVILAEIEVISPADEAATLYYADVAMRPFASNDADRPSQVYDPRLAEVSALSLDLARDLIRLDAEIGGGEIRLSNTDGALSYLRDYAFGSVTLYWGVVGAAFADFEVLLAGTCGRPRFEGGSSSRRRLVVPVSDPREALDRPIQSTLYAGTSTGTGTGYEGSADLADRPKPIALGAVANITAPWANAADLVLQVHDGAYDQVTALYSGGGGAGLTLHGTSTGATFDGVTLDPDEYEEDRVRGLVKLGGALTGRVTLDIQGDADPAYADTAQALIERVLARMGVDGGDIGASFASLAATETVGVWIDREARAADIVSLLARSIGAWVVPDRTGTWQIGQLAAPAGAADATFDAGTIIRLEPDDRGAEEPVHKVTVRYARNATTMRGADLAGAVQGTDREAYLAETWRQAVASAPATLARWPRAQEVEIETALTDAADAQALAVRWLTLFGPRPDGSARQALRVTVEMTAALLALPLGAVVQVTDAREGLDLLMLVVGKEPASPRRNQITFRLWG